MLGHEEALNPDSCQLAEGDCPAQYALSLIGEPALPEVVGLIESTTNSYAHEGRLSSNYAFFVLITRTVGVVFHHELAPSSPPIGYGG